MTKDIDLASVNFELKNTDIFHEYVHASYDPTMKFTGINITLMRDGEGGEIILSNVDVSRTTRGNGISIALLDRVCDSNMYYLCASLQGIAGHCYATKYAFVVVLCNDLYSCGCNGELKLFIAMNKYKLWLASQGFMHAFVI